MKRLLELVAIAGLLIAFLVLLYGDNWLGWHPSDSETAALNQVAPPAPITTSEAARLPPANSVELPLVRAPVMHEIIVRPVPATTANRLVAPSSGSTTDDFGSILRRMNRSAVESRSALACHREVATLSAGLGALVFRASIAQNQFYNTNSSKAMIADLEKWLPDARRFLADNKAALPDVSVFEIANPSGSYGTFHRDGNKAWATMDAKRKAIESISRQLEAKPCDKIGKAAVAECDELSNCQAPN